MAPTGSTPPQPPEGRGRCWRLGWFKLPPTPAQSRRQQCCVPRKTNAARPVQQRAEPGHPTFIDPLRPRGRACRVGGGRCAPRLRECGVVKSAPPGPEDARWCRSWNGTSSSDHELPRSSDARKQGATRGQGGSVLPCCVAAARNTARAHAAAAMRCACGTDQQPVRKPALPGPVGQSAEM